MLEIGTTAPDFTLPDQNGTPVTLSSFRGQKVILYFYPKDMTAGCTKQACGFRELYPQFRERGAVVLGVSKDSVASHCGNLPETTYAVLMDGLFTTVTNVNFNGQTLEERIAAVHAERDALLTRCGGAGETDDYDMARVWTANEDIRSLKSLILFGLRGMAAYAHHARVLGY